MRLSLAAINFHVRLFGDRVIDQTCHHFDAIGRRFLFALRQLQLLEKSLPQMVRLRKHMF